MKACSKIAATRGKQTMQSSVSFTLPISCQICLGKVSVDLEDRMVNFTDPLCKSQVKEPVTCSNQHVFCSSCMNVWLNRNSRCPTCRVEITSQSPLRKIIGGVLGNQEETNRSRETTRELRRARLELVVKEYEDEIFRFENEVDQLRRQNLNLKNQVVTRQNTSVAFATQSKYAESCPRCSGINNWDEMLDLSKKLQHATNTYAGMKEKLTESKKKNEELLKSNDDLRRENKRIREEFVARSPMKFGRLTVATLESRLEAAQREIEQLKRAMELNDSYIASLEKDLKTYKDEQAVEQVVTDIINNDHDSQFSAIVNPPLSDQPSQSLSQGFEGRGDFLGEQKLSYSSLEEGCSLMYDETSKASSFFELQGLEDSSFNTFTPPQPPKSFPPSSGVPASTPSTDSEPRLFFSRKLEFDLPDGSFPSSSQEGNYSFVPVNSQSSFEDDSQTFNRVDDVTTTKPSPSPLLHETREGGPWLQASPSVTKTVINAGGSRITMSQLSADDHDRFIRPSSAPSRTFLLSGSRFSALRPLDPAASNEGFQPVKCISPMHMLPPASTDTETRSTSPQLRLVAPNDVIDTKYRKNEAGNKVEDESRPKEVLSRVNILKRKTSTKGQVTYTAVTSSPVGEGRRKQKLYQKRGVEISFQSPQKSQRVLPK